MEKPGMIERLAAIRELHAAPKNVINGNLRFVTQAQLDFYFAAHQLLPALLAVVEAASDPDLFDVDDRIVYPAQKRFAAALAALESTP
jgi:hypothetical protein